MKNFDLKTERKIDGSVGITDHIINISIEDTIAILQHTLDNKELFEKSFKKSATFELFKKFYLMESDDTAPSTSGFFNRIRERMVNIFSSDDSVFSSQKDIKQFSFLFS